MMKRKRKKIPVKKMFKSFMRMAPGTVPTLDHETSYKT